MCMIRRKFCVFLNVLYIGLVAPNSRMPNQPGSHRLRSRQQPNPLEQPQPPPPPPALQQPSQPSQPAGKKRISQAVNPVAPVSHLPPTAPSSAAALDRGKDNKGDANNKGMGGVLGVAYPSINPFVRP